MCSHAALVLRSGDGEEPALVPHRGELGHGDLGISERLVLRCPVCGRGAPLGDPVL